MTSGSPELAELLDAWFTGWTALRSYRTSSEPGHLAALRQDRSDGWEYFIADPGPEGFPGVFAPVAAEVARFEDRALCVLGPDIHRYVKAGHAAGLGMLSASEQLMAVRMETQDNQDPFLGDPDLRLQVAALGGRRVASVCTARLAGSIVRNGTVLASGKVAIYGEYAVYDQVQTHSEHRHHGYGKALMQSLTAHAKDYPVSTGLLLASTDGQRLNHKMGWRSVGSVTVLVPRARLERIAAGR